MKDFEFDDLYLHFFVDLPKCKLCIGIFVFLECSAYIYHKVTNFDDKKNR